MTLRLAGIAGSLSPLLMLTIAPGGRRWSRRWPVSGRWRTRRAARAARLWGCGAGPLSARMEYTATSFAEPLQRVFDDVLRPEQDVDVTHHDESSYLVDRCEYRQRVPDRIERTALPPVLAALAAWGRAGRAAGARQHPPLPRLRLPRCAGC